MTNPAVLPFDDTAPAPVAEVPLADILGRTADEIGRCRNMVVRIETALHRLLDDGVPLRPADRAELQAIDLLDQRLADLSVWLHALSGACADVGLPRPVASLIHDLRLADLRLALSGHAPAPPPAGVHRSHPPGAAELF